MKVVIPARMGSERLPNKPLADIAGAPMIVHVWRQAVKAVGRQNIVVACDDARIVKAVEDAGGIAVMTQPDHLSGTDRVGEVVRMMGWPEGEIIINVQGDEPLIPPELIALAGETLDRHKSADIATLACPTIDVDEIRSPHVVKLVCSDSGRALYFSRSVIPFIRKSRRERANDPLGGATYLRHIGIYAYRVSSLLKINALPVNGLERFEALEQLRALGADMFIQVATVDEAPPAGVDTFDDLTRVRTLVGMNV